jgi:hypothetical protein
MNRIRRRLESIIESCAFRASLLIFSSFYAFSALTMRGSLFSFAFRTGPEPGTEGAQPSEERGALAVLVLVVVLVLVLGCFFGTPMVCGRSPHRG